MSLAKFWERSSQISGTSVPKAQVSAEFLMLIILMVLIFVVYVPFLWKEQLDIEEESEYLIGEKIAISLKKEIDTAVMFGPGYRRNFTLPEKIRDSYYIIAIEDKILKITWKNRATQESLIAHEISGTPGTGRNTISNQDDVIVFE